MLAVQPVTAHCFRTFKCKNEPSFGHILMSGKVSVVIASIFDAIAFKNKTAIFFLPSKISGRRPRPTTEPILVTHDIFCCEITTVQWACTGRWLCRFLPEVECEIFDSFDHWNRSYDYCCFTLMDSEDLPTIEKQPSQEEQCKNKRKTKQTIRTIIRKVLEKSHKK